MSWTETRAGRPLGGGRTPEESREHILDAAERCFSVGGLDGTSMVDIAGEADISRGLLYRHFSSRDEVVAGVLGRLTSRMIADISDIAERGGRAEDLIVDGTATVIHAVRNNSVVRDLFVGHDRDVAGRMVIQDAGIHDLVAIFWNSIIDSRPGLRDRLRTDISVDRIVDHVVFLGIALVNAGDQVAPSPAELRRYLRDFLVPVVIGSPDLGR